MNKKTLIIFTLAVVISLATVFSVSAYQGERLMKENFSKSDHLIQLREQIRFDNHSWREAIADRECLGQDGEGRPGHFSAEGLKPNHGRQGKDGSDWSHKKFLNRINQ